MNNLSINQLKTYFLITLFIILIIIIIISFHKEFLYNKKVVELFDVTTTTIPTTTIPTTTTPESIIKNVINTNNDNLLKTMDELMNNQMILDKLSNKLNKLKSDISEMGLSLKQTLPKEELKFF